MKSSILVSKLAITLSLIIAAAPHLAQAQTNSPGTALTFNASGSRSVFVPSQDSLNAFPITVMAWIKTTTTNLCAVVNKYHAVTVSGYELFLNNGHIEAFYFASAGNDAPINSKPLDGGLVNDGAWHHVAFCVDANGARLCKDGAQVDSAAWTGTPGPTATSEDLYLGYYPGITIPGITGYYTGEIDEVSLWNVALYPSQIQTYMNRSLTGFEPNLVAYWRLDEGAGTTINDTSGNGNYGYFLNSPAWTASTAPIGIVPPTGYSQHWAPATDAPTKSWYGVTASADGTRLAATVYSGGIYTSTNSGTNWQLSGAPTQLWFGIAGSADGKKLIAAAEGANLYLSTNSGTTWNPAGNSPANLSWESVACSADGSRMVGATFTGGHIYVSSDSGVTWSNYFSVQNIFSVASSSNGMKLAAIGAGIYLSTDGGKNWTTSNAANLDWSKIASSADGSKLLATVYPSSPNLLYLSTDSGATWNPTGAPSNTWNANAMSADGSKLFASLAPGIIYTSVDSGVTWQLTDTTSDYWDLIVTSVDGTRSVSMAQTVDTSLSPPAVHLAASGSSSTLSWPSPSTGFTLQQSTDLAANNWSIVPVRPNVTNNQNQVTVPLPAGEVFYRLEFP